MVQTERLLGALCKADVAFVVIGGMAAVAQGSSYVTADLDICYQRQPRNYERLSRALQPFHPQLRGAPADLPFILDAATLKAGLNFTLTTDGGDLDLMGEVKGLGDYEAVRAHAEEVEIYGYPVLVLTLAGSFTLSRLRDARKISDSSKNSKPFRHCGRNLSRRSGEW